MSLVALLLLILILALLFGGLAVAITKTFLFVALVFLLAAVLVGAFGRGRF